MDSNIGKKINAYLDEEKWGKARLSIMGELKKDPDNHWLLTRLSLTFYEQYNYKKALEISEKTMKLAPRCPLVRWDYAGSLEMLGQHKKAIEVYEKLLRLGVEKVAYGECGEGIKWARSLLNDCRYRLAHCYKKKGNISKAIHYYKSHIKNRAPGTSSIYHVFEVKKELSKLTEGKK